MLTSVTATLVAVLVGTLAGLAPIRAEDVQAPATLVFSFALLLGAAYPDGAWRRALVLGLSVPLAHGISHYTGRPLPYELPDLTIAFLALVPAFAGTLVGVGARRAYVAQQEKHPRG